ncbi:hypothetical protein O181_005882 [Austropuccinia psidii MF-1]|uniref:Uncharacterized protein n=1 Tax=Austropuccinia psidii MF-1 TaxID=1389203 RepID=A0A9Q3GH32_9BASI|nr:hypothetical protein [Austropuccinia psidii MF-1]
MALSSSKFDLEDLRSALASVDQKDTQVRKHLITKRLGQRITLHLTRDCMNVCHWSRSLCLLVKDIFYDDDDGLQSQNNAVQIFILRSIDESLLSYVEEITLAKKIYHLLESCFTHILWSHIINIFTTIFDSTNDSESPNNGYTKIQDNIIRLKSEIGQQWRNDSLMEMFFHHYNKQNFHKISNSLDARISINQRIKVQGRDIPEIAHKLRTRE